MVYYDADVWTCNERDNAFRKVMDKYPNIKIVSEQGFADVSQGRYLRRRDPCAVSRCGWHLRHVGRSGRGSYGFRFRRRPQ